jgi:hypothetical protein
MDTERGKDEQNGEAQPLPQGARSSTPQRVGAGDREIDSSTGANQTGDKNRKPDSTLSDRIKRAEMWMILLTAAIVVLTLGMVIVGVLQWRAMRGQLDEMKSGSADTHDLALAAKAQADSSKTIAEQTQKQSASTDALAQAAAKSVNAANSALKLTRDNFIRDQRPWLFANEIMPEPGSPRDAHGHFAPASPMFWRIYFSNYGRSPAFRLRSAMRVFHGPNAMVAADTFFGALRTFPDVDGGTVLPPGGPPAPRAIVPGGEIVEIGQQFTTALTDGPLTAEDLTFIYGHDLSVVVVGRIQYRDISGQNLYWLDFCRSTFLTGAINDCGGRHNEVH